MLWDLDDLAAMGDLARERGISSSAATNWRRYPDFPQPLTTLSTGPVYSRHRTSAPDSNTGTSSPTCGHEYSPASGGPEPDCRHASSSPSSTALANG